MDSMGGKVAIVTGASSGIGLATAIRFLGAGVRVAAVARREIPEQVQDAAMAGGSVVLPLAADVTVDGDIESVVRETTKALGRIDILVNAAGILKSGSIETTTPEDWDRVMAVNLRAPYIFMQKAMPYLVETKGNVVNVSSVNGLRAFPEVLAYNVSKAGVDHLTRCTALEMAPKGVRVNAVNPGVTVTGLHRTSGMDDARYKNFLEHSKTTHPLGRVGFPEEVAELIFFLASPQAAFITGCTYKIDGGRGETCLR